MTAKNIVKKVLRQFGYDMISVSALDRLAKNSMTNSDRFIDKVIASGADVIFDVGANAGQYATLLRSKGYLDKIVSFEPLQQPYEKLKQLSEKDDNWVVYNFALGAIAGESVMNVSQNFVSSSFLEVEPKSVEIEPAIGYVDIQKTRVEMLDTLFPNHVKSGEKAFLKLDVQGYEEEVLRGAKESLKSIMGLQVEMSIVSIYKKERLMHDMVSFLKQNGFYLFALQEGFSDGRTGQLLQVDGLFFRDE